MRIINSLVLFVWIINFLFSSVFDVLPFYIPISSLYDKRAGCQSAWMASPEISRVTFSDFDASVKRKQWEIRWHTYPVFMRQNNWSLLYIPSFFG